VPDGRYWARTSESDAVEIERFVWTEHAEIRLASGTSTRRRSRRQSETRIPDRRVNDGRAEWLVTGVTADGTPFEAIYDYPHGEDEGAVRIVSVWRLES
jgi:hypothetical protein